MTVAPTPRNYLERPASSGLADVIDLILDKGLVIDVYARVSLVGIELISVDARIVIASVDTYLRFAEAVNRLDLGQQPEGLPALMQDIQHGGARSKTRGALEGVKDTVGEVLESVLSRVEDEEPEEVSRRRPHSGERRERER